MVGAWKPHIDEYTADHIIPLPNNHERLRAQYKTTGQHKYSTNTIMTIKKFFTKEVKIGISFIVALAILIWGFNFLKGVNLFTPTNNYKLEYERIDGLVVSNNVMIKGYKVGQVYSIEYDFSKEKPFTIVININEDITLPKGTIAQLTDESVMGGKCINLNITASSDNNYQAGDTLPTTIDAGMLGGLAEMLPALKATVAHADSVLISLNGVINSDKVTASLNNIETITTEFRHTSRTLNNMIDHRLPAILSQIDTAMVGINSVARQLKAVDVADIIASVDTTLYNLNKFTNDLNNPNGTLGMLLHNPSMYTELTSTITSANNLLIDLKANPKRYVHFSLFGSKEKKKKESK